MGTLKKNYSVTKTNMLNEMRASNMNLQELRFMSIYLSKINKNDLSTRTVRFSVADFATIMEIRRIDIEYMKNVTDGLLSKVVNVPDERGGYIGFQLFKRCRVSQDDNGEWYVEIDAHDDALPLMFEYKEKYFSYKLWNALRLKSTNQLRMYELLKQYQRIGYRIMKLEELRQWLGIGNNEYRRYDNFKEKVLDVCKKALAEHTDITFTYEVYKRGGRGGKIQALKFVIRENKDHTDPLMLEKFIGATVVVDKPDLNSVDPDEADDLAEAGVISKGDARMIYIKDVIFDEELMVEDVRVLYNIVLHNLPQVIRAGELAIIGHMKYWLDEAKRIRAKDGIQRSFFSYLKKVIANPIPGGE